VDNGSTDGSTELVFDQPDISLVKNPTNLGFAVANNQGLRLCTGEYVLLVNPDVELAPDYVERAIAHFSRLEVGSVTGKLLRPNPPGTVDSTGHNVYGIGWAENRGEELPDNGYDQAGEVFGVCAAAAMYRRAALNQVAIDGEVFDESYFAYIEDVDLDWRLRWAGWSAWYEPAAVGIHHRSATGGRFTPGIMRHILTNRLLTVLKNYDGRALARNFPGIVAFTAVKTYDFGRRHPNAVLGIADAFRLTPRAMRWRRRIRAARTAPRSDVMSWLQPFPWRARWVRRLLSR